MEHNAKNSHSTSSSNIARSHRTPVRLQPISLQSIDARETESASGSSDDGNEKGGSLFWEIAETLLLALLIFMVVRTVVLNFRVDGLSMEPALDTGQTRE